MKQRIIEWVFILTALIPAILLAQWDTSLFDGESKRWGYGYERGQQCYSALVERLEHQSKGWLDEIRVTPRRWGSSWTLKQAKDDIIRLADSWANMSELEGLSITDWLDEHSSYQYGIFSLNDNFKYDYHPDDLEVDVGAPTNWLEDDPHWGVVTHPDGWKYLDEIVNSLTNQYVVGELASGVEVGPREKVDLEWMYLRESGDGKTPQAAVSEAKENRIYYPMGSCPETNRCLSNYSTIQQNFPDNYDAERVVGGMRVTYEPLSAHSTIDLYATSSWIYSSHGWVDWSEEKAWQKVETIDVGDSDAVLEIGPQSLADAVDYPYIPYPDGEFEGAGWLLFGWDFSPAGSLLTIRKFKVPNGFKYVEQP